jgi:transcriptional regulator with GAF, ATPase, and Fis domain
MKTRGSTKRQIFDELTELRRRVIELTTRLLALRESNERLQAQHDIVRAGLEEQPVETVIWLALEHIGRLVPCQRIRVAVFDFEALQTKVWTKDAQGKTWSYVENAGNPKVHGADSIRSSRLNESGLPDEGANRKLGAKMTQALQAEGIRPCLSVPLVAHDTPIGILNVWASSPMGLALEQIETVHEVARALAIVIHHASQHK